MPALDCQWMTHVDGATLADGDGDGDAEALAADLFTAVGNTPGRRFLKTGARGGRPLASRFELVQDRSSAVRALGTIVPRRGRASVVESSTNIAARASNAGQRRWNIFETCGICLGMAGEAKGETCVTSRVRRRGGSGVG